MQPSESNTKASVGATIDQLKAKLLDLSKRNRLIHYKPTSVSSVAVVDELPAEIFRLLVVQGKAMRFRPIRPGDEPEPNDEAEEEEILLPANGLGVDSIPADRHRDLWLQTRLPAERLDHSLRRIAEQASSVLEEQGVNSLFLALGMLAYYESDSSDQTLLAPLLLLPVTLERKGAGQAYSLKIAEDDPVLNPALAAMLRSHFGIKLPEIPEITDDLDPTPVFAEIEKAVASQPRWRVTSDIVLGLFSFHKFVMFKDLERNKAAFEKHRVLRQLVERKGTSTGGFGLPKEVRDLDLDQHFTPEGTFQVVDADSSQQRAIAATARGHDLVLEGPPGTGKSQTITNLIANALAQGKKVLFVSEKMAALDVVHGRLQAAGLRDFCLELHSQKANKKAVLAELARSIDATLRMPPEPRESGALAQRLRVTLSGYATALHETIEPLGWSAYRGFGEISRLAGAPRVSLPGDVMSTSERAYEDACQSVGDLARAVEVLGLPADSPWRDVGLPFLDEETRVDLQASLARAEQACFEFGSIAAEAAARYGLGSVERLADAARVTAVADLLSMSPGAAVEVLTSPDWNSPPPLAQTMIAVGRRAVEGRARARERFAPEVLERAHQEDIAVFERLGGKLLRMFHRDYRRVRRGWLQMRLPGYQATFAEQANHLRQVDATRSDMTYLDDRVADGERLFGPHWSGMESSWESLERYVEWVVSFRTMCIERELSRRAAEFAAAPQPDVRLLRDLAEKGNLVRQEWSHLVSLLQWPRNYLADGTVSSMAERIRELTSSGGGHSTWRAYVSARDAVLSTIAGPMVPLLAGGCVAPDTAVGAFRRAFVQKWIDSVIGARPVLRDFSGLTHEQRIQDFRQLDRKILADNQTHIQRQVGSRAQEGLTALAQSRAMTHLRGQIARGRGHAPLRRTLHESHEVIKTIKPCFMMSPITVAQFLDPEDHRFDIVIFDEASQMTAEDAVGAVVRGDQLVVVGDPKQLPPTSFFSLQTGQASRSVNGDGADAVEDFESILEQFMAAGAPTARLRWHYRSRHESLIAFSNLAYYSPPGLHTFPSADVGTADRGLTFEFVPDGVYEGAGLNRAEARRVAEAVMQHARKTPTLTLGVGTFNTRQQTAVQDELERLRRESPELEPFFAPRVEGGFFVKNLENIQGDDRDVIFLSVTYAKGQDGKLRHNFGPLNGANGWRRLNVLITRSRLRMRVFSSMHGDEIDPTKAQAQGARNLRDFLLFAERGILTSPTVESSGIESYFEEEVAAELTRHGVRLVPQVGVAGYRMDFGVLDSQVEGRFICGIECDGASYHSAETARDRDRLRQEVLEGLGWTLHRVWSTDWFKDRAATVKRLLAAIEASRMAARLKPLERHETVSRSPIEAASPPIARPEPGVPASSAPISCKIPRVQRYQKATLKAFGIKGTLNTPEIELSLLIDEVVEAEAPVHQDDLRSRVAMALGDLRAGSKITSYLEASLKFNETVGLCKVRGGFVYANARAIQVRNREGAGIAGERIAPEEYVEAVHLVMKNNGTLSRETIVAAVRDMLGYSRAGGKIQECINRAIDTLLADGVIGQGATGLALRK